MADVLDGVNGARTVTAQACRLEADDLRHLQHAGLQESSDALHELVERIGQGGLDLPRQMGVELRRAGAAVPEVLLEDAGVHPHFQQMRRVGMAQRVDMGPLGDPGPRHRPPERALQTAPGDRSPVVQEGMRELVTGRCGEQPHRGTIRAPVGGEPRQGRGRQGNITVLWVRAENPRNCMSSIIRWRKGVMASWRTSSPGRGSRVLPRGDSDAGHGAEEMGKEPRRANQ